jgi:hypothetical protein
MEGRSEQREDGTTDGMKELAINGERRRRQIQEIVAASARA